MDVQLKNRLNIIPNILKIAQKFMDHEKTLLNEITELRTKAEKDYDKNNHSAVNERLAIAEQLSGKMGKLMVAVEAYPDLKSDQTMLQAMQAYNEVEAQIAAARRFYNSAVTSLNNSIQIFPGNIIANMAGVSEMPFYEADEAAKQPVSVDDFLK
ncbi:MAG: LemA family protein [Rickettsiales bacterium]